MNTKRLIAVAVLLFATPLPARAQWIVPPTPANKASVTVTATVTYDAATALYTYEYEIASAPSSEQDVTTFALRVDSAGKVGNSPTGWTFGKYLTRPLIEWSATEAAPEPPGFVDDGGVPPAAHPIRPGTRKSGFRFVSADSPGTITYYVQGEVPLPQVKEDVDPDSLPPFDDDIEVDSVKGTTVGPVRRGQLR